MRQFKYSRIVFGSMLCFITVTASGVIKPHAVGFGKWNSAKWCVGTNGSRCLDLKVRGLYVDGRMKEFMLGPSHDVTERTFVVRTTFRENDNLPTETVSTRWTWQRGGWLTVDRVTGHISSIALPEFDPYYSVASWYRDYGAYCGVSNNGKKSFAIVFSDGTSQTRAQETSRRAG